MRGSAMEVWRRLRNAFGSERLIEDADDRSIRDNAPGTSDETQPCRSVSTDYTELMGGSVPCPSCKGSGRIPKELEETLVALIPVNDDRLKPKHTWRWIVAVVLACLLIASGVIFMLVPRDVELWTNKEAIDRVHVFMQKETPELNFWFINYVNISNANFYAVEVENMTATILSKLVPWSNETIGNGGNSSVVSVSPRNRGFTTLAFNNTVMLKEYVAEHCTASFSRLPSIYINMQFDLVVSLTYFNHREKITLSMLQQVCCIPTGNCTPSSL